MYEDHNYGACRAPSLHRATIGTPQGDSVDHNRTTLSKEVGCNQIGWHSLTYKGTKSMGHNYATIKSEALQEIPI